MSEPLVTFAVASEDFSTKHLDDGSVEKHINEAYSELIETSKVKTRSTSEANPTSKQERVASSSTTGKRADEVSESTNEVKPKTESTNEVKPKTESTNKVMSKTESTNDVKSKTESKKLERVKEEVQDILPAKTEHRCRNGKLRSDNKPESWATLHITETVTPLYFGSFIELIVCDRGPAQGLRIFVTPPKTTEEGYLIVDSKFDPPQGPPAQPQHLRFSLKAWPVRRPCPSCPLRTRLFERKTYTGFLARSNVQIFASGHTFSASWGFVFFANGEVLEEDSKTISKTRTLPGSLFWYTVGHAIQKVMPLASIRRVLVGPNGPFWQQPSVQAHLTASKIQDECLTLESGHSALNLAFGSAKQRKAWLQHLFRFVKAADLPVVFRTPVSPFPSLPNISSSLVPPASVLAK